MISARPVEVIVVENHPSNPKTDSIAKSAGITPDKPRTVYTVELWRSPLNYRGYKMAKNKIVVFGINQPDGLKLYRLENDTYLKTIVGVYRLEPTSEYRQLEVIDDEMLLSRLK